MPTLSIKVQTQTNIHASLQKHKTRARSAHLACARGSSTSAAQRELFEDMRGVEGECARMKNDVATSCKQTRQTVKKRVPPPPSRSSPNGRWRRAKRARADAPEFSRSAEHAVRAVDADAAAELRHTVKELCTPEATLLQMDVSQPGALPCKG